MLVNVKNFAKYCGIDLHCVSTSVRHHKEAKATIYLSTIYMKLIAFLHFAIFNQEKDGWN